MAVRPDTTSPQRTTGRTRLSRELILDRALEMAAHPEAGSLRIRDLGMALGADPSAIYRHFQNKNDLMTGLIGRLEERILARVDADPARDWTAVLTDFSEACLELYLGHPVVGAEAASIATTESTDIVELIVTALHRGGLRGDAPAEHYTLFASYLLSFTGAMARSRLEYGQGLADRAWAEDVRVATPHSHPVTSLYRDAILTMRDVDVYRSGIRRILTSAAASAQPSDPAA